MSLPRTRAGTVEPLSEAEEESYLPKVLPAGWIRQRALGPVYEQVGIGIGDLDRLCVIVSGSIEEDGRKWLHVSLSRRSRTPSWEDVDAVKRLFVGDDRYAYQVHPPRAEHYTSGLPGRGSNVLHLWAPLEGAPPLPNFLRARGGTL